MGSVHWPNNERLHGYLDDVQPTGFEADYAAQQTDQHPICWNPMNRLHQIPSESLGPATDGEADVLDEPAGSSDFGHSYRLKVVPFTNTSLPDLEAQVVPKMASPIVVYVDVPPVTEPK